MFAKTYTAFSDFSDTKIEQILKTYHCKINKRFENSHYKL